MKKFNAMKEQVEQAEKTLDKDDGERKLSIQDRAKLEDIIKTFNKKKSTTIDYRVFMIQKEKTDIQADVLDDAFLQKAHKYDVQEMDDAVTLGASNYRYLLG